jgi:DHA1 family multidrug resistance protein-like MFS transporter
MITTDSASVLHTPLVLISFPSVFLTFSLPIFAKNMGASAVEIGALFSLFTVSLMVLRPLVGMGLDRYGRRPFFITALIVYGSANLIFSISHSLDWLYLARLFQGIGASLLFISIDTITADLTEPDVRAEAMGMNIEKLTRGGMYGAFLGFTLLGMFPMKEAWSLSFTGFGLLALLSAAIAFRRLPETLPEQMIESESHGLIKVTLAPQLVRLMVVVFVTGFAYALIEPIYLIFLQDRFEIHILQLAWAFLPAGIVFAVLPSRLGRLSDKFGRDRLLAGGLVLAGTLYIALPNLPNLLWLVVLYTTAAVGWAMSDPAKTALVADFAEEGERGRVFGIYELVTGIGRSLGPLVGGFVYDNYSHELPFYLNGGILVLSAIWVLLYLRPEQKQ